MSKKTNTWLFIIGASIFNIIVTFVSFIVLLVLYGRFLAPMLPQQVAVWGLPVVFIGSIVIGFVVYRIVLKAIMKRVNMEDTFDPLFKPRRPVKKD